MTKVKLVTDSSIQLTPEEVKENDIHIIPLSIEIDGKVYVDEEDITRQDLITALKADKFPKTSQPPVGRFVELYDELGKDGSEVLAIMMSDVLSGTFETATAAASMTKTKVTVINSKSTDRGLAFQVLAAAKDLRAGKSIAEIKAHCADIYARTEVFVLVDTLDNLVKGGRVSRLAGALTKLINLKLIVQLNETSLDVFTKGRSKKTFFKFCKERAKVNEENPVTQSALSNVGSGEDYLDKLQADLGLGDRTDCLRRLTSPIIMTHTGLNAVGVILLHEKTVVK